MIDETLEHVSRWDALAAEHGELADVVISHKAIRMRAKSSPAFT